MDIEPCKSVHAFKLFEAIQRDLGCAGDELEELGAFFLVEGAYGAPEPLDLRRCRCVVVVVGVVLPVVDVDVWQTGDEELKLLFVEDSDQFSRDDVVEA